MYKGFSLSQSSGFAAREFDKTAPAPGLDWSGEVETWLTGAASKGWVTKSSERDAKVGALLIGADNYPAGLWVGIVRTVSTEGMSYETLDKKGKKIVLTKDYASLRTVFQGYIWPERPLTPKRAKLILTS